MKEGLLAIFKIFVFLLVLPLVIAAAGAFQIQILGLPVHKEQWFLWGMVVFLLLYLFFYNFKDVHTFGQGIVSHFSKSFQSLANVAGSVIPIYTVFIICLYLILNILGITVRYEGYLLFVLSFSITMHIVLTAHQLYEADSSPLKAQYFLVFSLAFVVSLLIVSLLLGLTIPEFSFIDFFKVLSHRASSYYGSTYKVFFVSP